MKEIDYPVNNEMNLVMWRSRDCQLFQYARKSNQTAEILVVGFLAKCFVKA